MTQEASDTQQPLSTKAAGDLQDGPEGYGWASGVSVKHVASLSASVFSSASENQNSTCHLGYGGEKVSLDK